ncbi:bacteriophage Mu Gp45 protein [Acetobacteraceae bacterium AT-5844]|nr:bacteriophage Mu Gp45 protein [Acetobacteraceae bacterium AT-5844]
MSSALERMAGRLLSLVGFGRVTATTALAGKGLRRAQVRFDDAETRDETPLVQQYGFASRPLPGADAILVFVGGNRSKGIVIATNDRRYQIELAPGEVALHTDEGDFVHIRRGGTIGIRAATKVEIDTPLLTTTGRIEAAGDVVGAGISLQNHRHTEVERGGEISGPPQS